MNWTYHPSSITNNGWQRSPQATTNNHHVRSGIFANSRHIMQNTNKPGHSTFGINRINRCSILCMAIMKTEIGKFIIKMTKKTKHKTLTVKNLGFKYLNSDQILHNLNFEVSTNEVLCLLGPNGCGKTTLLDCLIGLNKINVGEILINDEPTRLMSAKKIAYNLGYVPQTIVASFDYSVIDYVVCGYAPHLKMFKRPGKKEYEKAYEALKQMKITHLADKSYAQISGGEQQQVCIARVITQAPDFILLDEPTSHLDFGNQIQVLKLVKKMTNQGFGIIMTTHNPDHALLMKGKTVMMKKTGEYVYGKTEKIVTQESLRKLYGVDLFLEESKNANRNTVIAPNI